MSEKRIWHRVAVGGGEGRSAGRPSANTALGALAIDTSRRRS
ncbi:MAG: hypothetical protein AVDCRST_MAG59-4100 [uncultured Thermomicrobiales bacterium]|uniref:Uncharacterized protein n=1 Tax=uncultured Thermomicrobiales bacterium TaxID=1645740 RepID=A0A6J4VG42_9BACT|nr:MAG: hypothetical protein AVDCRST_MAG59-4100 [uncultured Thermomicrobiales bacterium]